MSTSRMAHGLRIFPYGRNVAAVVSAVMKKDRQDAAQKRRSVVRIGDPFHEAKRARGGGGGYKVCPRRLVLLARANHPWASPPRFERFPPQRVLTRRGRGSPTSTRTSMCRIILVVSFFD
jgi:hypothetical protein